MNFDKWTNTEVPVQVLGLKLSEETGEVNNIIVDNLMAHSGPMSQEELEHLIEECDHVAFIASEIQYRARKELAKKKSAATKRTPKSLK